ncbi:MAG: YjgP/YjgQ family permease [Bacteroidetes bacterium]|nr:YjgP/YjgQ family permease [Bacteroidota bacterium]
MKKLHKYMIRSFIGPFILTFGISMIVLLLQFVWKWIDELVGKGLDWKVIIELLVYVSMRLVPLALILGVLLSSIMTFGNLGEHNELTSTKASGISLFRTMKPLLVFVLFLTVGAFTFSNYVVPVTNLKFYTLLLDIRQQRPEFIIKEGQFYNGLDGYSLKIGSRSKDGQTLYNVMIYDHTQKQGNVSVTVADSGYMNITEDKAYLILSLHNGFSYSEQLEKNKKIGKNKPLRRDRFSMQQFLFHLPETELNRSREDMYRDHYNMLSMAQLADTAAALEDERTWRKKQIADGLLSRELLRFEKKTEARSNPDFYADTIAGYRADSLLNELQINDQSLAITQALAYARVVHSNLKTSAENYRLRKQWINRHLIEWHRKLTLSFACMVFFLIGAPLGAIIRKGGLGTPVVVSIVFFISYHIITLAGEKYARGGILPVWEGMWGSTLLLFPLGVFLTYKSNRDSAILVRESYYFFSRRIISFFKTSLKSRNEDSAAKQ